MKNIFLLCACALLFTPKADALGTMSLEGKIHSFSDKVVSVQSKDSIFYMDRTQLSAEQNKILKATKTGQNVTLSVDFRAISRVESRTK